MFEHQGGLNGRINGSIFDNRSFKTGSGCFGTIQNKN